MKKCVQIVSSILVLFLCFILSVPTFAAPSIEITRQPQSQTYPESAVATFSVEANGSNLQYNWFVVCDGVTYNISKMISGEESMSWGVSMEGFVTSNNIFYLQGVLPEADGAKIYCEISNGSTTVKSDSAYISVGGTAMPPTLVVPAGITVDVGTPVDIYCAATTYDGSTVEYLWYETSSGRLEDIIAINRGEETGSSLHCDTDKAGTRYYVCMVTTSKGGSAYTNVIPIIVRQKAAPSVSSKPSATASASASTPAINSSSSITGTESGISSGLNTSSSSAASKPEISVSSSVGVSQGANSDSQGKSLAGLKWWIIGIAALLFVLGGVAALIIVLIKTSNNKKKHDTVNNGTENNNTENHE